MPQRESLLIIARLFWKIALPSCIFPLWSFRPSLSGKNPAVLPHICIYTGAGSFQRYHNHTGCFSGLRWKKREHWTEQRSDLENGLLYQPPLSWKYLSGNAGFKSRSESLLLSQTLCLRNRLHPAPVSDQHKDQRGKVSAQVSWHSCKGYLCPHGIYKRKYILHLL